MTFMSGTPFAIDMQGDRDETTLRFDRECAFFSFAGGMQVAGENAEPVAGFLGFAAIRIVNAETEIGLLGRNQREDAVAAEPPMAVANAANSSGGEREAELLGVHDHIVVPESMPAKKPVLHLRSPCCHR